MKYSQWNAILLVAALILGYGATSVERSRLVAIEAPVMAVEYAGRGVDQLAWTWTSWRARRGDPCALYQVGLARLDGEHQGVSHRIRSPWRPYIGGHANFLEARRLIIQASNLGCLDSQKTEWMLGLRASDPYIFFRDVNGRLDWDLVRKRATQDNANARYLIARTRLTSPATARRRGIEFDKARGLRELRRLAASNHFGATMDLWQMSPGTSPMLARAYTLFRTDYDSPRAGYLIFKRYMGAAIDRCDLRTYDRAITMHERIENVSRHKRHEVNSMMNRFAGKCMQST